MDDFEQRLKQQSLRPIPAGWRTEILEAGRGSRVESREQEQLWLSTFVSRLSTVLWPHPKAWAGLAAVWIFIFAVHFSIRDPAPVMAAKSVAPSPEVVAELKQQNRMFAELIGANDARDADRSKTFVPLPRSERDGLMTA